MSTSLNWYPSVYDTSINNSINIHDWFKLIKFSTAELQPKIAEARALKTALVLSGNKSIKVIYDDLKRSLQMVTYNALFTIKKTDDNFSCGTGYMYIDVDDSTFDINTLDKTKIFAHYKSLGGYGYSIIIKVDGITPLNFSSTYQSIINELGITSYIDTDAIKISQYSVISFDENIYINDNSFVFQSVNPTLNTSLINIIVSETNHPHRIKKEKHMLLVGLTSDKPLRYNNIEDFKFDDGDYLQNWKEGFDFVKCYLPTHKLSDGRKRALLSYVTNLVWLNPNAQYIHLYNSISTANEYIGITPLPDIYIKNTLIQILKLSNDNKLIPRINKRRILFDPNSALDVKSKLEICGALIKDKWEVEGTQRLYDIVEGWNYKYNGTISTRSVAINSDMNIKTIKKYWKNIKSYIADLNELNKDDIKHYNAHKKNISKDISNNNIVPYMADMDTVYREDCMMYGDFYDCSEDEYEELFEEYLR